MNLFIKYVLILTSVIAEDGVVKAKCHYSLGVLKNIMRINDPAHSVEFNFKCVYNLTPSNCL